MRQKGSPPLPDKVFYFSCRIFLSVYLRYLHKADMPFSSRRACNYCFLLLIGAAIAFPARAQKNYWSKGPEVQKVEVRQHDSLTVKPAPAAKPSVKTVTPSPAPSAPAKQQPAMKTNQSPVAPGIPVSTQPAKITPGRKIEPGTLNELPARVSPAAPQPAQQTPVPQAVIPASTTDAAGRKSKWSLQDAIRYAVDNNISIRQNELNARLAELTLKQSRLAQLPNANITPVFGLSHGRSIDPTTNQFVQGSYTFISGNASSDVLVFGWFKQRNLIEQNKLKWQAAKADLDQLKNDVSLNVATGFLRVLMAREQIKVNEKQVQLSGEQLQQTRKFAEAGRLPELNVAQLEAQLASDSSALISAISDYTASILDIKALLNLDFSNPFEATIPDLPMEERIALQNLNPDVIYQEAVRSYAAVRSNNLKVQAADKGVEAAKGALYPQLGLNGQLGTNWTSTYKQLNGYRVDGAGPTGAFVDVSGSRYDVLQPVVVPLMNNVALGRQLSNNFRQTISANLSIPLFNGWQSQYAVRQAKINYQTEELNKYQTELKLKQDVYKAHNDAVNAIQKYYAAERSRESAQRAFEFAEARYKLGLTNTVEYLTTQNTLYKAEASALNAKYDLIFKLKVIDYYLGKELKL